MRIKINKNDMFTPFYLFYGFGERYSYYICAVVFLNNHLYQLFMINLSISVVIQNYLSRLHLLYHVKTYAIAQKGSLMLLFGHVHLQKFLPCVGSRSYREAWIISMKCPNVYIKRLDDIGVEQNHFKKHSKIPYFARWIGW